MKAHFFHSLQKGHISLCVSRLILPSHAPGPNTHVDGVFGNVHKKLSHA